MERVEVKSTNVKSVGHEGDVLEVEFKNGGIYHYEGIDANMFGNLLKSPSVGSFVAKTVRPSAIKAKKIS